MGNTTLRIPPSFAPASLLPPQPATRNSLILAILSITSLKSRLCCSYFPASPTNQVTSPQIQGGRGRGRVPRGIASGAALLLLLAAALPVHAATLARIRASHTLRCGVNQETPEYSSTDDHGPRRAFDAEICRAVAIAILGPDARVILTSYPDDVGAMTALRAGKVDLLPTLTLDLTHASNPALAFSPPILYDGVGFLIPSSASLTHADQLSGKKICFLASTQVELSLRVWFARQHLDFVPFPFNEEGEMEAAFVSGNCPALAGDLTRLVSTRIGFGPLAARYALLPDPISHDPAVISQDPLAAASRSDDPAFARIVTWTLEVLLNAEASGLTQRNIVSIGPTADETTQVLTGRSGEIGARLGLSNSWATHVLNAVGNYGEIYDRTLGDQSPLKLPRAQSRLSTQGGLMLPLPLK